MQYHLDRSEHWHVVDGTLTLRQHGGYKKFDKHDTVLIRENEQHKFSNETEEPVTCIEIQYGKRCVEEDIRRLE